MVDVAVKQLHEDSSDFPFLSVEQNNNIQIWYNMRSIQNKDRIVILLLYILTLHFQ